MILLANTVRDSDSPNIFKYIRRYQDDFGFRPRTPVRPVDYRPGSAEKIEELRMRVLHGQPLHIKGDHFIHPEQVRQLEDESIVTRGTRLCGAQFSQCEKYRYRLWRYWEDPDTTDKPIVAFIGLNPSTADESQLDPTLRRLKAFSMRWGCAGFEMLNIFAYRATDPKEMYRADSPIGDHNDTVLATIPAACSFVVCCWGEGGFKWNRAAEIFRPLKQRVGVRNLYCFGLTKLRTSELDPTKEVGQPKHPLYLRGDTELIEIPWENVDYRSDDVDVDN